MRICVIGAGAMGAAYGGLLSTLGHDVTFVDVWTDNVDAINARGLRVDGVRGDRIFKVAATSNVPRGLDADLAMIWTDSNSTRQAAETAKALLKPDGFAVTLQNGIGNVETLVEVLGKARVAAGSSMCSAAMKGPGHSTLTHMGMTSLGEIDGGGSPRTEALAAELKQAGFEVRVYPDIMSLIWTKFALNCSINALCATTGLRLGELARLPAMSRFQDLVMDEILAVVAAKKITLADPDLRATVKAHCFKKFSRPSMMQHIDAGKRTEIDALNAKIVEEGAKLGVPTPYNAALVMLLKGVEHKARECRGRTEEDYA
ncbi:MAG: ketopantoate reductase family protein, partial [Alphaproteobacteria bacterium]|nr:ketopantoate reductase family protein [Alphaproteobacteria bacterium]